MTTIDFCAEMIQLFTFQVKELSKFRSQYLRIVNKMDKAGIIPCLIFILNQT